ncbi:ankyrin repeat domain-containing protein 18B-like [Centruroides sculpturatus]|uniref:ankyrin repeat domain-containing protein 18B-like n=1 Tax=Centruroides sculpturatus TaxID=218467 RepID=UPI000C6E43A2|nr:ankyrin repeat domain-containing protein 18B-like [Centruroides sculpturatus]
MDESDHCDVSELSFIHKAFQTDDVDEVKRIIKFTEDVNVTDKYQRILLHLAAIQGFHNIVIVLLESGANVNAVDCENRTPIFNAVQHGHNEIVKLLLEKGADISLKDKNGNTVLHIAIANKFVEIAIILIEKIPFVDITNKRGQTPLHLASLLGLVDIVKSLLRRGASIEYQDDEHQTPLIISFKEGHLEILNLLLQKTINEDSYHSKSETSNETDNEYIQVSNEIERSEKLQRSNIYPRIVEVSSNIHNSANGSNEISIGGQSLSMVCIPQDNTFDKDIIDLCEIANGLMSFASRLDAIRNVMNQLHMNEQSYEHKLKTLSVELLNEQKYKNRIEKDFENFKSTIASSENQLKCNYLKIQKLKTEMDILRKRMKEEKQTTYNLENYTNELKQREMASSSVKTKEDELDDIKTQIKKLNAENYSSINQRNFLNIEINNKINEIEEWDNKLAIAKNEKSRFQMQIEILHKEINMKQETLKDQLHINDKNFLQLNFEKESLEKCLDMEVKKRLTVDKKIVIKEKELQEMNVKYSSVKKEINKIQQVLENQSRLHCKSERELRNRAEQLRKNNQNLLKSINELPLALQNTEFQLEKENSEINRIFTDLQENFEKTDLLSRDQNQLQSFSNHYSVFNELVSNFEDDNKKTDDHHPKRKLFNCLSRKLKTKSRKQWTL